MQRFIMQPHSDLGRKGAVCPFAKPSHEERALLFSAFDAADMPFDTYIGALMRLPYLFNRVAAERPEPSELLSLAVYPLGLQDEEHYKFIDCAHMILKPFYMECGLMLGEFHPTSSVRGAHSDSFRPMRADKPLLVIRAMALHDALFIDGASTPIGMRVHELECYLRWNAERLSATEKARVAIGSRNARHSLPPSTPSPNRRGRQPVSETGNPQMQYRLARCAPAATSGQRIRRSIDNGKGSVCDGRTRVGRVANAL
ncbi:DUF6875 domain-containing protein [Trinickia sp. NRRL B-1857]|uniref:DUF6875 domain-containing protein n=1 Tax=Trinickia sp. NRRL B-1857 TaxID=3162879 RepID=UPI003D2BC23E